MLGLFLAMFLLRLSVFASASSPSTTNAITSQPLSLGDAINLALRQNPNIRRAQKDVEAAAGVAMQTRSVAIPKIRVSGNYTAIQPTDVDKPSLSNSVPGFTFGTDQSWASQIRLVQSIYEGGRVVSSLRTARLMGEQAVLNYQTTSH